MEKEITNNILPNLFTDDQIFAVPEPLESLTNVDNLPAKRIVVLYEEEQTPALLDFLHKILGAAKLDLENDLWIHPLNPQGTLSWSTLKRQLQASHLLSFGLTPQQLGITPPFEPFQVYQVWETTFLFAPKLSDLQQDKSAKGKLWAALQEIFLR